mmetsp:Transcript_31726/g.96590  ORF Transcript_31726/g.96590 Transcript_31726/m.96590 type:complete len:250 (-) Transcript_31726:752-1501(-)
MAAAVEAVAMAGRRKEARRGSKLPPCLVSYRQRSSWPSAEGKRPRRTRSRASAGHLQRTLSETARRSRRPATSQSARMRCARWPPMARRGAARRVGRRQRRSRIPSAPALLGASPWLTCRRRSSGTHSRSWCTRRALSSLDSPCGRLPPPAGSGRPSFRTQAVPILWGATRCKAYAMRRGRRRLRLPRQQAERWRRPARVGMLSWLRACSSSVCVGSACAVAPAGSRGGNPLRRHSCRCRGFASVSASC